jgi:hypothetical protein
LVENRFNKYLLYASGEIILVVIGILIALQINNWNEKRKQKELGYKYLTEMRYELQADVSMIDGYISRLKKSIENHEAALQTKDINLLSLDSLSMLISPINLDFKISELTYNKMNNLGPSELSTNNQLNTNITNYYNKRVVSLKLILAFLFESLKKYSDYFTYQQDSLDLYPYDEYQSLINITREEHDSLNRLGLIKFATSVRGRNLIIEDISLKRYALAGLESFESYTVALLISVYNELKEQNPTIDPLPQLPEEYNLKAIDLPEDVLKQYVGRYELTQKDYALIEFEKGELLLSYYNEDIGSKLLKLELYPYKKDKFYTESYYDHIFFKRENGVIKSLYSKEYREDEYMKID